MEEINKYAQEQIDNIKSYCKTIKPLVAIRCCTYNHESYIRDALEGFVMQQTDFPFVAIVHDDASTDKTANIVKEYAEKYPRIILPIFEKENQYSNPNGKLGTIMNEACKATGSKYIAICEGDDYWTDPLKLQKQVDILQANPNCSLVISDGIALDQKTGKRFQIRPLGIIEKSFFITPKEVLLEKRLIPTASMMYRYKDLDMPSFFIKCPVGDRPRRLWSITKGNVYYIKDPILVYRLHSNESFGQRVSSSPLYAKRIFDGMILFYNQYDTFTNFEYTKEIEYLKNQEEFNYYFRTNTLTKLLESKYFNDLSIIRRIKIFLKVLIKKLQ